MLTIDYIIPRSIAITVLFLEDWHRSGTVSPDFTTSNKTALRMANVYREMGNPNFAFHLCLYDQRLKGVDPHSKKLSLMTKNLIIAECKRNFWYFIREVLRVPATSSPETSPFRMHRGNIALHWSLLSHAVFMYLGPRQLAGKSLSVDCLTIWIFIFGARSIKMNLFTKDHALRADNMTRLRDLREALPPYLQFKARDDTQNTEEFTVKLNKNMLRGRVPATSPKGAFMIGRGYTAAFNHIDEPVFIRYIENSTSSMLASGGDAREAARRNGSPYFTAYTTTAGKTDDVDGEYVYKLLMDSAKWNESYMGLRDAEEFEKVVRANSRKGRFRINGTFYYQMLGYTKAQYDRAIEGAEVESQEAIDRDFGVLWTSGAEGGVLDTEILDVLEKTKRAPAFTQVSTIGFMVNFYVSKATMLSLKNASLILSLDPSETKSKDGDGLGITLRHPYTGAIIATAICHVANTIAFTKWLYNFFFVDYPKLVCIIEHKSMGSAILDQLFILLTANKRNPFTVLFNKIVSDQMSHKKEYELVIRNNNYNELYHLANQYSKSFGFTTAGTGSDNRTRLYSETLTSTMKNCAHVLYDDELRTQLSQLVWKNGRVDHPPGGNDDLVIALLISQHWLINTTNLRSYGLDETLILNKIPYLLNKAGKEYTPAEINKMKKYHHQQNVYRKKFTELVKTLAKTKAPTTVNLIRSEINAVRKKIRVNPGEVLSVTSLLQEIKSKKMLER